MKNSIILLTVLLALLGFAGMMRVKTDVQTLTRVPGPLKPRCMACFVRKKQEACAHVYHDLPR